jgi:hypothetical protein
MAIEKATQMGSVKVIPLENGPIKRPLSFALLSGPVREGPLQDLIGLLRALSLRTKKKSAKGDKAAGPAI